MPGLFCIALHPALTEIRRRLPPGAEIIAYLDDLYVVCNPTDAPYILHDVQTILRDVCRIDVHTGILAIRGKTAAPCPVDIADLFPNAWKCDAPLEKRGINILGTPFGSPEYVQAFGATLIEKKAQLLHLLPQLPSVQCA